MKRLPAEVRRRRKERLRWYLFRLQGGACLLCGERMHPQTQADASFEHITPRALGGTDAIKNLALSHPACNETRGTAPLTAKQMERARRWFGIEHASQDMRPLVKVRDLPWTRDAQIVGEVVTVLKVTPGNALPIFTIDDRGHTWGLDANDVTAETAGGAAAIAQAKAQVRRKATP